MAKIEGENCALIMVYGQPSLNTRINSNKGLVGLSFEKACKKRKNHKKVAAKARE